MSELVIAAIKIAYLALLWIFVLIAASVIRTDLFGRAVSSSELPQQGSLNAKPKRTRSSRRTPHALVITQGRQNGLQTPLQDDLRIGRSNDCALVLDDDYVSTRHARIYPDGEGNFVVEDTGSTNGTYVNGQRIQTPTLIGLEDTVRIGRTLMKLVP
ncbi:FHA domain-containing protein FhaB/FipA [Parenemella sanctibonifatiensis]|uniref:FHA domain-containing protein n=1 Tax=Parenemella sanctibonifatiensis TaxID=2016505 RepID=A0A255EDZ7_9ACTN|nr:FHA domain-containing protein [Parenemella sanctibonifatiensis]OYN85104.1 FHA domain-containing protein [Parenemella sanctibonifatiensis]OYN89470.1 FHA domain-containing protein [Parenemella sanctibonifatiensis]